MKISKRLSIKHRAVKRYNESHHFKPTKQTPVLGVTPYRNLLITGRSNSLRTSLGLSVLVNYVRNNQRLRLGQPHYVYLSNMEGPVGLILWELINQRCGNEMQILDDIDERRFEIYGVPDEGLTEKEKATQSVEISNLLDKERMVQVVQWFQQQGYKLKVSGYGQGNPSELYNNVRAGKSIIRYNDGVTALDCEQRAFYSPNCLLIGTVHTYHDYPAGNFACSSPIVRPTKAVFLADRVVQCNVKKIRGSDNERERMTELVKERGGRMADWTPQHTLDLIKALIQ